MFKRIKSELSPSFMLANIDGANLTSPEVSLTITFFDKTKHTRIETFEGTNLYIMIKYNLGVCIFDQVNENAQLFRKSWFGSSMPLIRTTAAPLIWKRSGV